MAPLQHPTVNPAVLDTSTTILDAIQAARQPHLKAERTASVTILAKILKCFDHDIWYQIAPLCAQLALELPQTNVQHAKHRIIITSILAMQLVLITHIQRAQTAMVISQN